MKERSERIVVLGSANTDMVITGGRHFRVTERLSKVEVGKIIDGLMLRAPASQP